MITLKTLGQATAQEVFDQVAKHLLTQMKKSHTLHEETVCLYRNSQGLKCAAGCLISDDEYDPDWETNSWCSVVERAAARFAGADRHYNLIKRLQDLHDGFSPSSWLRQLRILATDEDLNTDVLDMVHIATHE